RQGSQPDDACNPILGRPLGAGGRLGPVRRPGCGRPRARPLLLRDARRVEGPLQEPRRRPHGAGTWPPLVPRPYPLARPPACGRAQGPAFAGKVRLVLIDLPGHGRSDRPEVNYTMDLFARAVDAVLRDAGVEKAVLAGHSMGTPVVRQFYRMYPKKTLGLVAVDGALRSFLTNPAQVDQFVAGFEGPDFKEAVG